MIDVQKLAREAGFDVALFDINGPLVYEAEPKHVSMLIALVLEEAAKASETQLDEAEEARADKAFKDAYAVCSEDEAVSRGRHWMTVSTCNAVVRNCARAIRSLKPRGEA